MMPQPPRSTLFPYTTLFRSTVDERTATKPAAAWTIAGTRVPKVNGRDFVNGKHRYTSDMQREGMLHGKIVRPDRKSTRLNSSHMSISYAVFCLKKKKNTGTH